jgi:hypothetical protein
MRLDQDFVAVVNSFQLQVQFVVISLHYRAQRSLLELLWDRAR